MSDTEVSKVPITAVSVSAWGRMEGIGTRSAHDAVERCGIPLHGKKVDPKVASELYRKGTRARARQIRAADSKPEVPEPAQTPAAPPAPEPGPANDYQSARARRERADAERSELATAQMAGRLVDREAALKGVFDAFRQLRDAAFTGVKTQARAVVGLTDLREIEIALEDELRSVFASWEEQLRSRIGGSS